MLKVHGKMAFSEQQQVIQAALIAGFFSEHATFPIASTETGQAVPTMEELAAQLEAQLQVENLPADYQAASAFAEAGADFDWRTKTGLEKMFSKGPFLEDRNHDFLPDDIIVKFILPEACDGSFMVAASNLAFRLGMETTAINEWLLTEIYEEGPAILFREAANCQLLQQGELVILEGHGQELEAFSAVLCEHFPKLSAFETWSSYLQMMADSFLMKNLDGQLAYARSLSTNVTAYVSPEITQRVNEIEAALPATKFINHRQLVESCQKTFDLSWEVDDFLERLAGVYPQLQAGDSVRIQGVMSEDRHVRMQLQKRIQAELAARNVEGTIELICAHKQGYAWMDEVIIPALKNQVVKKVTIAFKPFLPVGVTEWTTESGATPSYNNVDSHDPDKWCDLPIRYLQELYPIQDNLIQAFGLLADQIAFVTYTGEEALTYEVLVETAVKVERWTYQASYSERPYLTAYPGLGKVHPPTGRIQVFINEELYLDEQFPTDIEKIWTIYQEEVLPACRTEIEQRENTPLSKLQQPFFAQLRLEITASEPDEALASRNDLLSSLDALHEDLYFAGIDYFKNYGLDVCGDMFAEPGLILPVISQSEGKPQFRVTLFHHIKKEPQIITDNQPVSHPHERNEAACYLEAVTFHHQQLGAAIRVEGAAPEVVSAYAELLEQGVIAQQVDFSKYHQLAFLVDDQRFVVENVPKSTPAVQDLTIEDVDLLLDQVIGYEDYLTIIQQLKRVPQVAVYQIATSYLGRAIYAVELLPMAAGAGYLSRTKRLTNYPSEIINARHHANEVSGTNGTFMLLRELLTNPQYQDVAEKLNLVIVPLENVDGAAIHYELQKTSPYWKLHVARFNGVGKEFYQDYFNLDTKYPEALGITRLYEQLVPDIMVDNHGVPTHEWEQPFSGYTSPSYKGFWLPRSLLYGYFWVPKNAEYRSNRPLNKQIEAAIADAISAVPEISVWNKAWASQFETYAHRWLPQLFPADYYKGMINYWVEFPASLAHRYPSIRYPWITSVAYTSEVADETAQGNYLLLCGKTHMIHDLATIDVVLTATPVYHNAAILTAEKVGISHTRLRPLIPR